MFVCLGFFFFKQKTAYEMRISDWSSDVCSSDLPQVAAAAPSTAASTTVPPVEDRRGFPASASDQGPDEDIVSRIVGAFHGWTDKQVFTLENGQVWQIQDTRASLAGVDLMNPKVTFNRRVISGWYMNVEGHNSRAKAERKSTRLNA